MKVQPVGEPYQGRQSYRFVCPGCAQYDEPGSTLIATHVFDSTWTYNGDGDRPTVSPSILLTGHDGRRCHSFVREGRIEFLSDCTHALAGQTVELPELKP
jgi:hypothetical protein